VRDKLKLSYRIERNAVTIIEERPSFMDRTQWTHHAVARFRYNGRTGLWTLYYADRNSKWHIYSKIESSLNVIPLLKEVDRDPTCIFWG